MLTKNAYTLITALLQGVVRADFTLTDGTIQAMLINNSGYGYLTTTNADAFKNIKAKAIDGYDVGLCFGDGNATPSINDHKLSGSLLNNLSNTEAPFFSSVGAKYVEMQATTAVKNKGDAATTIKEIGLFGALCASGSNRQCPILIDRTVLATPITIDAGETKSITYNIRYTYPTA